MGPPKPKFGRIGLIQNLSKLAPIKIWPSPTQLKFDWIHPLTPIEIWTNLIKFNHYEIQSNLDESDMATISPNLTKFNMVKI